MRPLTCMAYLPLLVWLILPVNSVAEVRIDSNRVIIEATFTIEALDSGCTGGDYVVAWTDGDNRCNEPTESVFDIRDLGHCHLKLIDGERTCLLMNARLIGPDFVPGEKILKVSLPIGETITSQNIEFLSGSFYTSVHQYPPHDTPIIEKNTNYIIELTDQARECHQKDNLVEVAQYTEAVQIPCCVGARGDVNCDGVVADTLDINRLVDYLWYGGEPLCCPEAADVAPVTNPDGEVNLTDLTNLVNYYNGIIGSLPICSEPSWP